MCCKPPKPCRNCERSKTGDAWAGPPKLPPPATEEDTPTPTPAEKLLLRSGREGVAATSGRAWSAYRAWLRGASERVTCVGLQSETTSTPRRRAVRSSSPSGTQVGGHQCSSALGDPARTNHMMPPGPLVAYPSRYASHKKMKRSTNATYKHTP